MGDRETGRQSEKDKVLQGKTRQSDDETASEVREPKSAKASGSKGLLRRAKLFLIADFLVVILVFLGAVWYAVREYMETPPYLDEARFPVRGIDISSHNGMMNLEAARADGIEFAFIKASEGESFGDPNFALNHEKATAAGMKVGAYHFFRFDVEGVPQAINFLKRVGNRNLDLGLVVDVEETGNAKGVDPALITDRLSAMVEYLSMKGYHVTLYSNRDGYYELLDNSFGDRPLWICSFSNPPIARDWSFWQYSHKGRVKGIKGNVDLNAFNGSRNEWFDHLSKMHGEQFDLHNKSYRH